MLRFLLIKKRIIGGINKVKSGLYFIFENIKTNNFGI